MAAAIDRDVVVGLGSTGVACARHLHALGREVLVVDTRTQPPGLATLNEELPDVPVRLGALDAELLASAERVVVSPGVSPNEDALRVARARGAEILGEIELFARAVNAPVAAITGSNGKSTVTAEAAAALSAGGARVRVGGNLGINALDLLCDPAPDVYVVELSSFQLETTHSLRAEVAAVLNVTPDHMDRYESFEAYAQAKARILDGARTALLNLDDPMTVQMAERCERVHGFTLQRDDRAFAYLDQDTLTVDNHAIMSAGEIPLAGRHNVANALAALAIARLLGAGYDALARGIRRFRGLPHRTSLVAETDGVRWVNDSKGTNVGATVAAVEGLARGRNLVLIAGGEGKQQDFSPLTSVVARHVHTLILFGRDAERIAAAVDDEITPVFASDLTQAVALARRHAQHGDTVLFSPACASFDMFASYEARGEAFESLLRTQAGR